MLEDESGRIRLVGERLKSARLVTGVIIGALGIETNTGDFEVVDICFAGMAPQPSSAEEEQDGDAAMEIDGIDHMSYFCTTTLISVQSLRLTRRSGSLLFLA